jgi:hypothetical protein
VKLRAVRLGYLNTSKYGEILRRNVILVEFWSETEVIECRRGIKLKIAKCGTESKVVARLVLVRLISNDKAFW